MKTNYKLGLFKDYFIRVNNIIFNLKQKRNYKKWIKNNEPNEEELKNQRKTKFKIEPKISIIVPMYNTPCKFFQELVECLIKQTYSNWELCLADGSKNQDENLKKIIRSDNRIKYRFLNENKGISGNTNECIKMATGDYIALFDHDDLLPKFALYEIVKTINENPNVEFIYTDEDKISSDSKKRFEPYFKPDFAIDTLRSGNYICHFSVFKKELMDKLEGERSEYDGAQDFDIILRMTEFVEPQNIIHIPKILYHWRVSKESTAKNSESKPYAYISGEKAVQDHLNRLGIDAKVKRSKYYGLYETIYKIKGKPKVNIIIPNDDNVEDLKRCVDSILKRTDYDNYEIDIICQESNKKEVNNFYRKIDNEKKVKIIYYAKKEKLITNNISYGVKSTDGEYILLLSNKIEIIEKDWLKRMLGICQREDVGIVGAKLLNPKYNTVYHAGIVLGMTASNGYIHKNIRDKDFGFFARTIMCQDVSAVTGECLLTKRKVYEELEGVNKNFFYKFYDIDFCLRARKKGYLVVYEPLVKMHYYENDKKEDNNIKEDEKTFYNVWKETIEKGDTYFNVNLRLDRDNCLIRTKKVEEKI